MSVKILLFVATAIIMCIYRVKELGYSSKPPPSASPTEALPPEEPLTEDPLTEASGIHNSNADLKFLIKVIKIIYMPEINCVLLLPRMALIHRQS